MSIRLFHRVVSKNCAIRATKLRRASRSNVESLEVRSLLTAVIADPGFESPSVGSGSSAYNYGPTGSSWTFTAKSTINGADTGSGLTGNSSGFTHDNPDAPQGDQVAFIQRNASITQTVGSFDVGTYALTLDAAQRGNYNQGGQTLNLLVDNTVVSSFKPSSNAYTSYTSDPFTVAAGSHTLKIQGTNPLGGDNTAFIDAIKLDAVPTPQAGQLLNGGFEDQAIGYGNYLYLPASSTWVFGDQSGLTANNSGFTSANPSAPEGSQAAFLQRNSNITQFVAGYSAGAYQLNFQAAQRGNWNQGGEDFAVLVDNTIVGTFKPSGSSYQSFSTLPFTLDSGPHTITISGLDSAGGDNTAFLDAVSLTAGVAPAAPTNVTSLALPSEVDVSWSAVSNAVTYNVYRDDGSGNGPQLVVGNLTGTSFNDTSVTNGTPYTYSVTGSNAAGEGTSANAPVSVPGGTWVTVTNANGDPSTVTPDIYSAAVSSFTDTSGGSTFAAGTYRVDYVGGAMTFSQGNLPDGLADLPHSHGFQVSRGGAVNTGTDKQLFGPTASAPFVTHSAGAIGVYLFDDPYADNAPDPSADPRTPTFKLERVVPTLSVTSGGDAKEAGPVSSVFTFNRTGDTANTLSCNFTLAGTADRASFAATDSTGNTLSSSDSTYSLTFSAGEATQYITITPIYRAIVGVNTTVVATITNLSSSSSALAYLLNPGASSATLTIQKAPLLESLTAVSADGTQTSTASDATATDLYVAADPVTGYATVNFSAVFNQPNQDSASLVLWRATDAVTGNEIDRGNFQGGTSLGLTSDPQHCNVVLMAGVDKNASGQLDTLSPSEVTRTINIHVIVGALGIVEFDGTELPHAQNTTSGGYVKLNDDNDNYQFTTPKGTTAVPDNRPNKTAIVGEKDLAPLNIRVLGNPTPNGYYTLTTSSTNISMWENPDKSVPITASSKLPESGTIQVFIEGDTLSGGAAQEQITLSFIPAAGQPAIVLDNANYTVFSIEGPSNLVAGSKFTYTANVPGGPTNPEWDADGANVLPNATDTTARVLWANGAAIDKLYYSPAPGFRGEFDANVVNVTVTASSNSAPQGRAVTGPVVNGLATAHASANINYSNTIQISAPVIDNIARGVRFLQFGYIQDLSVDSWNAAYSDGSTLTASMQGNDYVDPRTNDNVAARPPLGNWPWIDTTTATNYWDAIPDNATNNTFTKLHNFSNSDNPEIGVPQRNGAATFIAANMRLTLTTVLAVNTIDPAVNPVDASYYNLSQFGWFCDYSATRTAGYTAPQAITANPWRSDVYSNPGGVPPLPGFNTAVLTNIFQ